MAIIRGSLLPRFPAVISAAAGIAITRAANAYSVGLDYASLVADAAPGSDVVVAVYDDGVGYRKVTLAQLLAVAHTHTLAQISDMSADARTFNAAADFAAMRSALGLGSAALSADSDFAAAVHTHAAADISDSSVAGRAMLTAADVAAQTALLNAFTSALKGLVPASGGGTANFLRADGSWAIPPGSGGGGVGANMLLNGDFRINQRAAASNGDDSYAHDRWIALTQSGAIAASTILNQENSTPYMLRLTQSQASAQRFGCEQIIETANCRHARGQSVALSARVRCSAATTLRYAILEWTGTSDSVTSDVVNDWTNGTYTAGNFFLGANLTITAVGSTALSANTLTDVSLTGACGSSLNNLIVFFWTESTQAQNVTLDISKVKLEIGAAATAFVPEDYGAMLERCQRYLRKMMVSNMGRTESSTLITLPFGFDRPMRATPTGALTGTILVRDFTGAALRTANTPSLNSFSVGADGGYCEILAASWSPANFAGAGSFGNLNCNAGGILIDAEL